MQEAGVRVADLGNRLTALNRVTFLDRDAVNSGIDGQKIVGMPQYDDWDLIGVTGDRGNGTIGSGLDRRSGACRNVDALVLALGVAANNAAGNRHQEFR